MVIFDWCREGSQRLAVAGSSKLLVYFYAFFASMAIGLLLTPPVRALARRLGIVDQPDARRIHLHPTPRAGGVAVFIAFHVTLFLCVQFFPNVYRPGYGLDKLIAFFWASLLLLAVGLLDDAFSLKPYAKLVGQIVVAAILFRAGFRVGGGFTVALSDTVDFVVTVFWIVGAVNAFNLIDGMDGLASGLAMIASFGLAGSLFLRNLSVDAVPFLILAGAAMGFLRYNFNPASVFLGDSGSMFLGLAVGALPLVSGQKSELLASLGVPLIAMGIPIFDTAVAIWRRAVRSAFPEITAAGSKRLRGFMQADKDHVHHRVLALTMSQRKAAVLLYGLNVVLVAVGLFAILADERRFGVFLVAFIVGVFLIVKHLTRVELWDTGRLLLAHTHRSISARISMPLYMVADVLVVCSAWAMSHFVLRIPFGTLEMAVELPIIVATIFVLLAVTGTYRRVWSRALLRDFLAFVLTFFAGLAFAFALSIFFGLHEHIRSSLTLLFIMLSLPAMLGIRLSREILREAVSVIERAVLSGRPDAKRVLVCGGGERLRAFLRESRTRLGHSDNVFVVGVLDDDPNLLNRQVHGVRVLGVIRDLNEYVRKCNVSEVIITMRIGDDRRRQIVEMAREAGVPVSEWMMDVRPVA